MCDTEYIRLVRDVLEHGEARDDRTGTGTLSVFGRSMRFNLQEGFPVLTTKRVYFKGVVEELMWMIKGCTDAKELSARGVRIWDANGTRSFLDNIGLDYDEGVLGPIYGHQWRHYNALYQGPLHDYSGEGIDQLSDLIKNIKNNPTSRRHILTAWNPCQNNQMALPPCHTLCQFYVGSKGTLSCQLYQRSGDIGLGIPFNIASYALLTHLIACVTNLVPHELIHVIGDAHIYTDHIEAMKLQLDAQVHPYPKLVINPRPTIDEFVAGDISLENYAYSPSIKMNMAV